ncbi:YkvA family protein [Microvirga flavescens]|uniref:YkvA family protein n=1 Tax=Microvirga flavescens TaxID=2249811 RepID=UPI000DDA6C40|nr:YkvA family protein [Microvirga flavescens]
MSESITKPFTKAEIEAMRRAARDEDGLKRRFRDKLRKVGSRIPFAEDLLAAYFCAVDPQTPRRVKVILLGAVAYFVFPTDAISDFLPLIGFADDAAVLATAIAHVAGSITDTHRKQARDTLQSEGRQKPDAGAA